MNSSKERSSITFGKIVLAGLAGLAIGFGAKEIRQEYFGSQATFDPILKISPIDVLPSAQASKEQLVDPRKVEGALVLLESAKNEKIADLGRRLRTLKDTGRLIIVAELTAEERDLEKPGRFPGTLLVQTPNGVRIEVEQRQLEDEGVNSADLAIFLASNLEFALSFHNLSSSIKSNEDVERLRDAVFLELAPVLLKEFGSQTTRYHSLANSQCVILGVCKVESAGK